MAGFWVAVAEELHRLAFQEALGQAADHLPLVGVRGQPQQTAFKAVNGGCTAILTSGERVAELGIGHPWRCLTPAAVGEDVRCSLSALAVRDGDLVGDAHVKM